MDFLQTTYFQIAAVAVAVLLVLLFILLLVRRKRAEKPAARQAVTGEAAFAGSAAGTAAAGTAPLAGFLEPGTQPPAQAVPVTMPIGTDPLVVAISSLITTPHPLTEADLRRLTLYRPDRVLTAVDRLTSTVSSGKEGSARLEKLAAIRREVELAQQEAELVALEAAQRQAEQPVVTEEAVMAEPIAAEKPAATTEEPVAAVAEPAAVEAAAAETPAEEPGPELTAEPDLAQTLWSQTESTEELTQANPATELVGTEEAVPFEETVPLVEAVPLEESPQPLEYAEPSVSQATEELETIAEEPLALEEDLPQEDSLQEDLLQEDLLEEDPIEEEAGDDSRPQLAALGSPLAPPAASAAGIPIEAELTAEEFLALDGEERAKAISRLSETELARAFGQCQESAIKTHVIDQLEELGTPEALLALDECLLDSSPDMQIYALNAAERLLSRRTSD